MTLENCATVYITGCVVFYICVVCYMWTDRQTYGKTDLMTTIGVTYLYIYEYI